MIISDAGSSCRDEGSNSLMVATFVTPLGLRRRDPGVHSMKSEVKVMIEVKVAHCLWAIAAIICLLI